ncbi:MAG: HAD-IA family hydrolase [Euzebyales bacterium]|nr:HAD-IA family hydrolase [Euzebyales bacterium]
MDPPAVVAFDVNETLVSLAPLGELLPEGALPLWFTRVLRDGFALTATGDPASFADLARTHLRGLVDDPATVLDAFRELDVYPDVAPAMELLARAGVRMVTLTNGAAELSQTLLGRAGLDGHIEHFLSADQAGVWKPRPEPYHHAARVCGVEPAGVALVAVHSWDVHGAKRAGLTAGWCSRLEGRPVDGLQPADVTGDDLVAVAEGLVALR